MSAYDRIHRALESGAAVLLDGAMGSELVRRGVRWRGHGLRTDAAAVQALHEEYAAAGADVIRTNTFQLNRRTYQNVFRSPEHMRHIGAPGLETRAETLSRTAVELARAARERAGREVAIAGVMSPLEHCFRPDLAPPPDEARAEHAEIARRLANAGAELLFLESMNTVAEARAAAEAARETDLPVWLTFVLGPEGEILSGEPLADGVRAAEAAGAQAVGVDGAFPDDVGRAVERLRAVTSRPILACAQIGRFDPPSWKFEFHPQFTETDAWTPDRYAQAAAGWRALGARIVGGGNGTTPAHVRRLREAL